MKNTIRYYYKMSDCDIYWKNKRNFQKYDMPIYTFKIGDAPNGYWRIAKLIGHEYYYPKSEKEAREMIEEYLDKNI